MFSIHRLTARLGAVAAAAAVLNAAFVTAPLPARAADEGVETAAASRIVPAVALPGGTLRATRRADLDKLSGALRQIAARDGHEIGAAEVLVWTRASQVQTTLARALQAAGYTYAPRAPIAAANGHVTVFSCAGPAGRRELLGMWVDMDGILMLSWGALTAGSGDAAAPAAGDGRPTVPADPTAEPLVVDVAASARTVNVMGKAMPSLPSMPALAPKPGVVRGWVRDTHGWPLKGALIGVRSTAVGGFYSGASVKTDAQGYYEVKAPWGAADFYCAGYVRDYGDGLAAFGLAPADGDKDGFASAQGVVKNWVLLPYGVADRAAAQDQPQYAGNYYGGTIVLSYDVADGYEDTKALPAGATLELTLKPSGTLIDGSRGRTIMVRRAVGSGFAPPLYVNNIPAGAYRVSARLAGGGPLRLRETGPYASRPFGLDPKEATGEASLLLKAEDADPNAAVAARGHWQGMSLSLERP